MWAKKPIKIFTLSIFILVLFYLNLGISKNCKSLKIFRSSIDFGISHLGDCYSNSNQLFGIKSLLLKNPTLYEIARKYRRNVVTNNFIFDNPPTNEEIKYAREKEITNKNLEIPFIQGLLNYDNNEFSNRETSFEFENWNRSHGDHKNSKFHPGNQINKGNIKNLKLIWKYDHFKNKKIEETVVDKMFLPDRFGNARINIESNPIFIDNKIISVTIDWKIIANDATNGNLIWDLQSITMPSRRGMVAYKDKILKKNYLLIPLGNKTYKINVENGKIEKNFGKSGSVDSGYTLVAPLIYKNQLIVVGTSSLSVFNIDNGKFIKRYSLKSKEHNFLRGAVWGGAALDKKNGIVFVNTGNPQPGIYGTKRPGENKNSSSVIAFDLINEKILWTFQETMHDVWDYDIPSPPILHDLKIGKKVYEVVISVTKVGNTLILERSTGKPIFDINYRRAPKSNIPGDVASPFQIFLKKPERFMKIEYGISDFSNLSKKKRDEINYRIKDAKYGWFETPSFDHDIITFGVHGGALWPGASLDPINQYLYIPTNKVPTKLRPYIQSREVKTFFTKEYKEYHKLYLTKCSSCHGKNRNGQHTKFREREIKNIPSLVGYYSVPGIENKLEDPNLLKTKHKGLNLEQKE